MFKSSIPLAVKAAETSAYGKSIFEHDGSGKVALAYAQLAKEVVHSGQKQRDTHKSPSFDELFLRLMTSPTIPLLSATMKK